MQLGQWSEALPVRANLEAALGFVLPSRTAAAPEDYSAGVIIRLTAWYLASAVPHTTYSMAPIHPAWPVSEGTVSCAARLAPRQPWYPFPAAVLPAALVSQYGRLLTWGSWGAYAPPEGRY